MPRRLFTLACLLLLPSHAHADAAADCAENRSPEQAIAGCSALLAKDAANASAYFIRGTAYLRLRDYGRAAADFGETIKLGVNSAEAFNNRSLALIRLGDVDGAIADSTRALAISGPNAGILANRADAYRKNGQFEEALADYTGALSLDPKLVDAYVSRGAVHSILDAQDTAIADFSRALELDPGYAEAFFNRGAARYATGDYANAAADLERASAQSPNPYAALIGYLSLARSGKDGASAFAAEAQRMTGSAWPQPLFDLYLGKQQPAAARAAAISPSQSCEAEFYIGAFLLVSKKASEAVAALKSASETCPAHYVERMLAAAELKRMSK